MNAESVWDYPRPPRVEPTSRRVRIELAGTTIVDTSAAKRVLETSHPPAYYVPADAVPEGLLRRNDRRTFCEFKGTAHYWDVVVGDRIVPAAAWSYPDPSPGYEAIRDHLAFYPRLMDACHIDDEVVAAQPGDFYGGWITREVTGPFKGGRGSAGR